MFNFEQILLNLTKVLYPSGRAFKTPVGSVKEGMHIGLIKTENTSYSDALAIFDSIIPDNDNFTEQDASDWERRLGIVNNPGTLLEDRKAAIIRKMNHPGTAKARQHFLYLEGELQKAGFDVFVFENRFPDGGGGFETKSPDELVASPPEVQHGNFVQHGDIQHGLLPFIFVVNHVDETLDSQFNIGANLRSTFFIGGAVLGDFADIPVSRKDEFRKLILNIKPVQTVGFLFINYT